MPSTVPQSQHMEFWLRDKGLPTQHTAQGHTNTQRSPDRKTTTWASYMYLRAS